MKYQQACWLTHLMAGCEHWEYSSFLAAARL